MRYYSWTWILFLFFAAMPAIAAEKMAPPYAPFVNDSTFAIVKVDPARIDVKQLGVALGNAQDLLSNELRNAMRHHREAMYLPDGFDIFDVFATATGRKPLYFVFSGCHCGPMEPTLVVCFEHPQVSWAELSKVYGTPEEKRAAAKKSGFISSEDLTGFVTKVFNELLYASHEPKIISQGSHGKSDYLFATLPIRRNYRTDPHTVELFSDLWPAVTRPDLEAALTQGADAPITVAVALPKYMVETLKKLLRPSETLDVGTIIEQGFRWASFTLRPEPVACNLTIQARSPEAAANCEKLITHCVAEVFTLSANRSQQPATQAVLLVLQKLVTSKVSGDQLQYSIATDQFDEAHKTTWEHALKPLKQRRQCQACTNNMKQLGLAMHNYVDAYGHFPPAYTVDKEGKPLHSWRVLLLPFIEKNHLYKKIRLDEPWNSEYNKQFHNIVIKPYQSGHDLPPGQTYYSVVVGEGTMFPPPGEKNIHFRDIKDGTSNTVMVVERAKSVCWMEPNDPAYDELLKGNPSQKQCDHHGGEWHLLFGDASVHTISKTMDFDTLKAILTINGQEVVDFGKVK